MKIKFTDDPAAIRIGNDEATIHSEVKGWIKDMVLNIRQIKDRDHIRQAEREFYDDLKAQYNAPIAAECLMSVWRNTKEENDVY